MKPTWAEADQLYNERRADVDQLLREIKLALVQHRREQFASPANWGHAGDLGKVAEELRDTLAFLNPSRQ